MSSIAHRSRFASLAVDDAGADVDDDDYQIRSLPDSPTSASATPSKKARARARARERKAKEQLTQSAAAAAEDDSAANGSAEQHDDDFSIVKSKGRRTRTTSATSAASSAAPAPAAPSTSTTPTRKAGQRKSVEQPPPVPPIPDSVKEAAAPAPSVAGDGPAALPVNGTGAAVKEEAETVAKKAETVVKETAQAAVPPTYNETAPAAGDGDSSEESADEDSDEDEDDEAEASKNHAAAPASAPAGSLKPQEAAKQPEAPNKHGSDHDPNKRIKSIITRTVWGIVMAAGAIGIILLGHVAVIMLVFLVQAIVFSELTSLIDKEASSSHATGNAQEQQRRQGRRQERSRWSKKMSWYFFAVTNYFLYGESLIYYFKHILTLQSTLFPATFSFAQHHRLISFLLYVIGFVSFVANLRRNSLRRQFGLFGWIHMSLLLIVVSSHFVVNNIMEGMIWFMVPVSVVIINDIAAYACGMAFGRHQLIKLSPKKTVEGYVGAFPITILFSIIWGTWLMRYNYMICPVRDLATNVFSEIECTPNHVFMWRELALPTSVINVIGTITGQHIESLPWAPFQLHCVVHAIFASLVAPFGGFFASGFKRAFGIKDFGDSIPGHGGMTDRMDCQFLMGLFAYVYYASLVRESHVTVGSLVATALTALSRDEQEQLVRNLTAILDASTISPVEAAASVVAGKASASEAARYVLPWQRG